MLFRSFYELHGYGAGAGADRTLVAYELPSGICQRDQVYAAMFKESLVLCVEQGANKKWRYLVEGYRYQSFAKLLNELFVGGIDAEWRAEFDVAKALRVRNLRIQV